MLKLFQLYSIFSKQFISIFKVLYIKNINKGVFFLKKKSIIV